MKVNINDVWNCDLSGHDDGDGDKVEGGERGATEVLCRVTINSKFYVNYWRPAPARLPAYMNRSTDQDQETS